MAASPEESLVKRARDISSDDGRRVCSAQSKRDVHVIKCVLQT